MATAQRLNEDNICTKLDGTPRHKMLWTDQVHSYNPLPTPLKLFSFNQKLKRKYSCLKYSLHKKHTIISKHDFICINMTFHLSIL